MAKCRTSSGEWAALEEKIGVVLGGRRRRIEVADVYAGHGISDGTRIEIMGIDDDKDAGDRAVAHGRDKILAYGRQKGQGIFRAFVDGRHIDGSQRYKDTDRYVPSSEVTFLAVWRKQVTITAYDTYDNVKMGEWTVADYDNGFTATFSYRWLVYSNEFELRMDGKTGIQYEFSRSTGWYGYTYTITIPADQCPQDEYETD